MRVNAGSTAPLGDVVVAAFDEAAHYSADPHEVSVLAVRTVLVMLRRRRARKRRREMRWFDGVGQNQDASARAQASVCGAAFR